MHVILYSCLASFFFSDRIILHIIANLFLKSSFYKFLQITPCIFSIPGYVKWEGLNFKSKIHPGNTEIHFMDLLLLLGRDLDGDFAFPIPSILTSTMSFWLPLKWAHHETVSEGTTDPFSWFHSVERTCFERKGGVCLERKNQKNIFIKIWSVWRWRIWSLKY